MTASPSPPKTRSPLQHQRAIALRPVGTIAIPHAHGSAFDHGAFDPKTRRIFIAHTGRDCVEVIDHDAGRHVATLRGFSGAAGVVADDGQILVTNRGAGTAALLDAETLKTTAVFDTGARPNGAALINRKRCAVVACIGDDSEGPTLQSFALDDRSRHGLALPGRPRWCATDAAAERLFLAIREPSMVLVAELPDLKVMAEWKLPSAGAHGLDIDHGHGRIFVACDDGALVAIDSTNGAVQTVWPIAGPPDVTFFNPSSGLVHVAIGDPGIVESIDPDSGRRATTTSARAGHSTVLVPPDRLYVISPDHDGLLVLADD